MTRPARVDGSFFYLTGRVGSGGFQILTGGAVPPLLDPARPDLGGLTRAPRTALFVVCQYALRLFLSSSTRKDYNLVSYTFCHPSTYTSESAHRIHAGCTYVSITNSIPHYERPIFETETGGGHS